MGLEWHGDRLRHELAGITAKGLFRAATIFKRHHQQQLNKSNPPPHVNSSVPGEYPRARTGFGRSSTTIDPPNLAGITREQKVRIGYLESAWYMAHLEIQLGRLGLEASLEATREEMAAFSGEGSS